MNKVQGAGAVTDEELIADVRLIVESIPFGSEAPLIECCALDITSRTNTNCTTVPQCRYGTGELVTLDFQVGIGEVLFTDIVCTWTIYNAKAMEH